MLTAHEMWRIVINSLGLVASRSRIRIWGRREEFEIKIYFSIIYFDQLRLQWNIAGKIFYLLRN